MQASLGSRLGRVAQRQRPALRERAVLEPFYAISTLAWVEGYMENPILKTTNLERARPPTLQELPHVPHPRDR